jgi:para-nitrobenzyl esterase
MIERVETPSGWVVGRPVPGAEEVVSFKGIPFGMAPVGDGRWRPPRPAAPWSGEFVAERFAPACPQEASVIFGPIGRTDEDCLALNVWTAASLGERRPVMVWLHGGGFTTGTGSSPLYAGTALAKLGAVVVTINYRLGPLGFLAHEALSAESPGGVSGNDGLRDQLLALRWVRESIAGFGGDPERVTLFGESAGAASIARLLVCPEAKGLFQRAILQSGGPIEGDRRLRDRVGGLDSMEEVGRRLAVTLGCHSADPAAQLRTLRAASAADVLAAARPAQGPFANGDRYGPVIDAALIPGEPLELIRAGRFHRVPIIAGTNLNEGTIFLPHLPIRTIDEFRGFLRDRYGDRARDAEEVAPARTEAEIPAALDRHVTALVFGRPARKLLEATAAQGLPSFGYRFTRTPALDMVRRAGCFHSLEIGYVFGTVLRQPKGLDDVDRRVAEMMGRCWVRFAETGDPNGPGLPEWPPLTDPAHEPHLEFGNEFELSPGPEPELCRLRDRARFDGV